MAVIKEFREFALRGSVVDMAVGIIVGAAFTTVVQSLVSDLVMPPMGLLVSNVNFSDLFVVLKGGGPYPTLKAAQAAGAVTLNYGVFINNVITFMIVSWATFLVVRGINRVKRRQDAEASAQQTPGPTVSEDTLLLREIRDSLKRRR